MEDIIITQEYLKYYLYVNPKQSTYRQNKNLPRYQNICRVYLDEYKN